MITKDNGTQHEETSRSTCLAADMFYDVPGSRRPCFKHEHINVITIRFTCKPWNYNCLKQHVAYT